MILMPIALNGSGASRDGLSRTIIIVARSTFCSLTWKAFSVMFFENIRSERLLMRQVVDRLSVRWYVGYDLDEPLPDHSTLSKIRTRYGLEVFRRFARGHRRAMSASQVGLGQGVVL
jgi:hypothetical protein